MRQAQCDIIIPVFNRLDLTRDCLKSIYDNTESSLYNIILIDNGSSPETRDFLSAFKDSHENVELTRNQKNLGWVKGVNQGIAVSKSPYLCLMNNDTIVRTKGWLSGMIDIASLESEIGLVNPNFRLKKEAFSSSGKFVEIDFCRGYCVLMKRAVTDRIGLLDESYGLGYYDDDDFSVRAIRAGFRCMRANAVYVEHIGDSTFSDIFKDTKRMALHERNKNLFYSKWGRRLRIVFALTKDIGRSSISDILLSIARRQHIVYLWNAASPLSLNHINIRERALPSVFRGAVFSLALWMNRIKREAKRYDLVFTDDERLIQSFAGNAIRHFCVDIAKDGNFIRETVDSASKV